MNQWIPQVQIDASRQGQYFGLERHQLELTRLSNPPRLLRRSWAATVWAWLKGAP